MPTFVPAVVLSWFYIVFWNSPLIMFTVYIVCEGDCYMFLWLISLHISLFAHWYHCQCDILHNFDVRISTKDLVWVVLVCDLLKCLSQFSWYMWPVLFKVLVTVFLNMIALMPFVIRAVVCALRDRLLILCSFCYI